MSTLPEVATGRKTMAKIKKPKPAPDFKLMFQLAERYAEASKLLEQQSRGGDWACHAPQMLVDSFATELYLKCLFVLDSKTGPIEEHDWEILFNCLVPEIRNQIRDAFNRKVNADPVLSNLHVINPEALKTIDFDRSLKAAKNTFDKRRYLFEPMPQEEWFYTGFIREAVRAVTIMDLRIAPLVRDGGK
jgi:hypothetical protein